MQKLKGPQPYTGVVVGRVLVWLDGVITKTMEKERIKLVVIKMAEGE